MPTGFLLDFISCPVIKGFTSAASITIGFGQIKVGTVPLGSTSVVAAVTPGS
jgi:MFS superfamily sulfate permease-like transporter